MSTAMLEGLRRRKKTTETEPGVDPGRRAFLRGLGATAAFSAIPVALRYDIAHASNELTPEIIRHREALLDKLISIQGEVARSQDVRDALEGKGGNLTSRALRPLGIPIRADYLEGTKYDASQDRRRYCVQLAFRKAENGKHNYWLTAGKPGQAPLSTRAHGNPYANGVFFKGNDKFLTAQHIAEALEMRPHGVSPRDLHLYENTLGMFAQPGQVIEDDPMLSDEHIHGAYVSVEGIDPDQSGNHEGHKTYPSIALRMRRGLAEAMFKDTAPHLVDRVSNSFMIALPPGEARGATPKDVLAAGMSGSPVFVFKNGKRQFAGIIHSVTQVTDHENKRMIDVGFFHGIDQVREYLKLRNKNISASL